MLKSNNYYSQLQNFPLLSGAQELELSCKIKLGDSHALDLLVKSNLRLVVKIAKRYKGLGLDFDDLVSEGNIGLLHAAKIFDDTHNSRFSTFASINIRNAIVSALRTSSSLIRTPQTKNGKLLSKMLSPKSLDAPILNHDENATTLLDTIKSPTNDPLSDFVATDTQKEIARALKKLPARKTEILRLHYGIGCKPQSLSVIGNRLFLSKERVRQLESRALFALSQNPVISSLANTATK